MKGYNCNNRDNWRIQFAKLKIEDKTSWQSYLQDNWRQ